ncbi:amidohydrolase/deacetylase family metallohydrolase [Brevibacillus daliensis]|uniref:amidohydrolase/deacetylase family metallohydrolase n=1 Tax=Brevibacillus daliensis TaxID=2892995 RepID=UPI001E4E75D4|nr:amidohydrolase/deacetylase family metallohydrolase [Brevibacillus daliensis]
MKYDLCIQNAHMIDPATKRNGRYHIWVHDGRIAKVISSDEHQVEGMTDAIEIILADEMIVTPGLIDLHVHVYEENTPSGIAADRIGVEQGVTTVVDAGSAGVDTFKNFVSQSIEPSRTEILAWINISRQGFCDGRSELADLSLLEPERTVELVKKEKRIIGIKARMSGSVVKQSGIVPLQVAKKAARELGLPLMIHIGNAPPELFEILPLLDKGDVVTHAFHGKKGGIFTSDGTLLPEAQEALERGVIFDVGHGTSSFSFRTMRLALSLGIKPKTISTDIYRQNFDGPVHSLPTTMSKLLALGVSLEEVIEMTTSTPAQILRRADQIGTMKEGTIADISLLKIVNEEITLTDSEKEEMIAHEYIQPVVTVKAGKVFTCYQ